MEITPTTDWKLGLKPDTPLLIAGPCSAETSEQVSASFLGAQQAGAQMLRAGIWKPRTRPNSFEGVGEKGLPWVMKAASQVNLPVAVEVARPVHVEKALRAGVQALWIGARTTVNPFAVQDLVSALDGVDIPILIKNPINPDLELWIGAFERFQKGGHRKLMAIHRGFSVSNAAPYRNEPMWGIPIELKRRFPQIEIISDPSHIAGRRDLLRSLSQKAMDLEFRGWMIETHHKPEEAWSDAAQQLTGTALTTMLQSLTYRDTESTNPQFLANLEALRYDIDLLDAEVIQLLGKRMEVVREIGKYKAQAGITILQMDRWKSIFEKRVASTKAQELSDKFAQSFIQSLHEESMEQQSKVMNTTKLKSSLKE